VDDDGTGWHEVLVGGWSEEVRDAAVRRVEGMTLGWRGPLVRVLAAPDDAPGIWTEALHRAVIAAIAAETGADLDELGSHAAWACYEEVWQALTGRWEDGGELVTVPLGREAPVAAAIAALPPVAAEAAGADVTGPRPDPLWLAGRLRVDVDGLRALLARGDLPSPVEVQVEVLLDRIAGRR
jgi:hypothetical protein